MKLHTASTTPPPPVNAENHSTPPPHPPPLMTTTPPKQHPQDLPIATNPPPETSQNHQQQPPPRLTDKVSELRSLSASLSSFLRRYDELQAHLDFIRSKLPQPNPNTPASPVTEALAPAAAQLPNSQSCLSEIESPCVSMPSRGLSNCIASRPEALASAAAEVPNSVSTVDNNTQPCPSEIESLCVSTPSRGLSNCIVSHTETIASPTAEVPNSVAAVDETRPWLSEIQSLCVSMSSRGLYNYIVSHVLEVAKLRQEGPGLLGLAPNPVKLVLECLRHGKDSTRVEERKASVLVLEFLLLMGGNCGEIEAKLKEEAEVVAMEWRNRVFKEGGGVKRGCEVDGRALLLLIGCFGIPSVFKNEDVRDLIEGCNVKEISESLRRSDILVARIPEIVEEMMKKKMAVKAVDIACTFGMESRYPPQLCMQQFLKQSKDTVMEERKVSSSDEALNEANKKYLANLKSALKCLVDHKIDPHIPGWNIPILISGLQRSTTRRNKRIEEKVTQKREADEPPESLKNLTSQEVKRTRLSHNSYVDGKSSSEGLIPTNLLNGGIHGHNASFSASSSGLHVPPAGPYPGPGVHGGMPVDSVGLVVNTNGQPYRWHGDAPSRERLIGCSYAEPTPLMIGHMGGYNVGQVDNNYFQPNVWHGNAPLRERVIGHSHPEPASLGVNGVFRVSPSIEGFVGLLNPSSTSSRKPDSGLYGFADTVI
ncbi:protein FRIGIDA-like isoform X3 [Rhododendron vialii]|uniref:protein FRIGIDA-like isoform X3 n=1 Tax=Rhododendron vialii TaxID=182163 RepID=UPI00265E5618|nr:protein FRIGIDA-like isoform X3 [Rhododendron vialii]